MRKKPEYEDDLDIFRTQAWIRYSLNRFRIDLKTFAKHAIKHASALKQAEAWYHGEHKITPRLVEVIDKRLTGSAEVFDLPLFHLLTADQLDEQSIHRILAPYYHRAPNGRLQRALPPLNCASLKIKYPWDYEISFFKELVYQADIHAFTLLLGMCWLAFSRQDTLAKVESMKAAWRILPAIEHLGWIWPMRDVLRRYCWKLHERVLRDCIEFVVDSRTLETLVYCWRRRPISFRDSWQKLSWDSGEFDPVVVYDRRSRRPIRGEIYIVEGTSELIDNHYSKVFSYDLMPHSMSRKEWRVYLAG